MDFSIETAKVLAKRSCMECNGRGYITRSTCGDKQVIVNPYRIVKVEKEGKIEKVKVPVSGVRPIVEFKDYCICSQKKIDKLEKIKKMAVKS